MLGGSVSATVTIKTHVALFPGKSVAAHVTIVGPTGKLVVFKTSQLIDTTPVLSVAFGLANTYPLVDKPGVVLTVADGGHVITGAVLSFTITENEQLPLFPEGSCA